MPVGGVFRLSGLPVPLVVVVEEIEVVDEVVEEVVVEAEETEAEGEAEEAKAEEKVDGVGKVALDVVVLVILMAPCVTASTRPVCREWWVVLYTTQIQSWMFTEKL